MTYVLDASVAAKWILPSERETLVEESLRVRDDWRRGRLKLIVPDLFWSELGNVLWKAVRTGKMSGKSAEEAFLSLSGRELPTVPSFPVLKEALGIALAFNRTVYDSVYLATAIANGISLLTADERLANALAATFPIRWLGSPMI